jgi:putative aldouronate transport system substrate-binding protein
MKNTVRKVIAISCMLAVTATLATGCKKKVETPAANQPAVPAAPVKVSIITGDQGRIWKDDNPVTKEIEKKTNTIIEMQIVPAAQMKEKYSVLAASSSVPDISMLGAWDYQAYADQGLYLDLTELLKKAPNLTKNIKKEEFDLVKYKGKQFAIPYVNAAGKMVPVVRQDWLDNLGLKMPTNLTEFEDMLKKFTLNDPDKDGKANTYGLSTDSTGYGGTFEMIFGAYGIQKGQSFLKDNKIYAVNITNEYKAALEYIKKLWDAKVIDPELFIGKTDQQKTKIASGKMGSFIGWWSNVPQIYMAQFKMNEVVPGVKWNPINPLVKGPEGKSGIGSRGNVAGSRMISAKSQNPEAAMRLLDFLASDEGYTLSYMGIKGTHYEDPLKGYTEAGTKAKAEKWLDPLSQVINRLDLFNAWTYDADNATAKENGRFAKVGMAYPLIQDIFYGVPVTDEEKTYAADLLKYEDDMLIKFITGAEPLSNWDQYVNEWKNKGGKKILDARIKKYNELFAKSYTAGN